MSSIFFGNNVDKCMPLADKDNILNILSVLGEHFALVIIGCIELLVGVFFIVHSFNKKRVKKNTGNISEIKGIEKIFLNEIENRRGEVFIIMRHTDKMPLYVAGDIEDLLGVTIDMLQKDVTSIGREFKDKDEAARLWQQYINWDEHEPYHEMLDMYEEKTRLAEELSEHMLSLINDILDMSRIEAGKVELEDAPFSLKELGKKLYDMFAKNLEERGIKYSVNFESMTVDDVIGDELRISQVIINFLSNAVKFTDHGEVSVKGEGSDFFVYLHLPVADTSVQTDLETREDDESLYDKTFEGKHILMAEDNEINALIAVEIIESMGATIEVVGNGKEAVDRFSEHEAGYTSGKNFIPSLTDREFNFNQEHFSGDNDIVGQGNNSDEDSRILEKDNNSQNNETSGNNSGYLFDGRLLDPAQPGNAFNIINSRQDDGNTSDGIDNLL